VCNPGSTEARARADDGSYVDADHHGSGGTGGSGGSTGSARAQVSDMRFFQPSCTRRAFFLPGLRQTSYCFIGYHDL